MEQEFIVHGMILGAVAVAIGILLSKGLNWIHKCKKEKRAMAEKIENLEWELTVQKKLVSYYESSDEMQKNTINKLESLVTIQESQIDKYNELLALNEKTIGAQNKLIAKYEEMLGKTDELLA